MRGACQVADLTWMIRATRGRSIDREDLIICVARLVVQKLCPPLTCDDFRVSCIASRNKFRSTSIFGAIVGVLGAIFKGLGRQNGRENRRLEGFFAT